MPALVCVGDPFSLRLTLSLSKMAFRLAMGKFSHLAERRGDDDDDDGEGFDRLPRKGLANVNPLLSVKYYRMDKVKAYLLGVKTATRIIL